MKIKHRFMALIFLFFLGSAPAFAGGMSCYVDTAAYDEFSPNYCFAMVWGARTATAVFRIDDLPANRYIDWHAPNCSTNSTTCSTTIYAFSPYEAKATVINLDNGNLTEVSATAYFEDGR